MTDRQAQTAASGQRKAIIAASAAVMLALALGGCGKRQPLQPQAGESLPPTAYGSDEPSTSDKLLEPSTQARPDRSTELQRRSEPLPEDPFELPPE